MATSNTDNLVELVSYPAKSEVDMLLPHLEESGIRTRVENVRGTEVEDPTPFTSTASPRGAYRILVPPQCLDEARQVCQDFEDQREEMRQNREIEREPQELESPDDAER